jgi:sulfate adenylyltransferase subunit 1
MTLPISGRLLRLATAGSVDDGKSSLVGRLLHDSQTLLADQLAAVEQASRARGLTDRLDLSLFTDGLRAEREQGITIDVAYRYFATANRTFVLADTPGHVQYTRNTVTGMSTAEAAVILVDIRNGVVEQTRRHATVAALLGVPHVVLAVNKMDLVDFDEVVFKEVAADFTGYAARLGVPDVTAIPLSARYGDNVVEPSARTPWYTGPTLLTHLEQLPVARDPDTEPLRYPVQYVVQAPGEGRSTRWYAGQLASGVIRVGAAVTVQPAGHRTEVAAIAHLGRPVDTGFAPMAIAVLLSDDIDVARGDLLVATEGEQPTVARQVEATVAWLADRPARVGERVLVKHTTRTVRAVVSAIGHRLHIDTLAHQPADTLQLNDIGAVTLRLADAVVTDRYADHRRTGSFLIIDEHDGTTLAAGMVGDPLAEQVARVDQAERCRPGLPSIH